MATKRTQGPPALPRGVELRQPTNFAMNVDSWVNVLTGLGTFASDKRTGARHSALRLSELEAEDLWRGSSMGGRIVETRPKAMLRGGFQVAISDLDPVEGKEKEQETELDPIGPEGEGRGDAQVMGGAVSEEAQALREAEEDLAALCDDLQVDSHYLEALNFERAYGGAAILLGARDGQADLSKPLNLKKLQSIEFLYVLRPRECWPMRWNTNPLSAGYGHPVLFRIQRETMGGVPSAPFDCHVSRLIRFDGVKVSRRQQAEHRGWGDSVFVRVFEDLRDFELSHGAVATLLNDISQAVYGMQGLADAMSSDDGQKLVIARAKALEMARSICRALIIDKDETFERKATPLNGVADILDRIVKKLAAAADMPVSLLMGESPAGLNATGDANIRWFYDDVKADQRMRLRPKLNRLVKLLFLAKNGPTDGVEPRRWTVRFPELWQETEGERAKIRLAQAQADVAYVNAGVLMPEEVAISRFGGDVWSPETHLDNETREQIQAVRPEPGEPGGVHGPPTEPVANGPGAQMGANNPMNKPPGPKPPEKSPAPKGAPIENA
jgi:hypothetical protein